MTENGESVTNEVPARQRVMRRLLKPAIYVLILIVIVFAISFGVDKLSGAFTRAESNIGRVAFGSALLLMLILYALLLSIPFVPGVEVGISLLAMQGGPVAPYVYAATVLGLMMSYGFGHLFSGNVSCRFLGALGFTRACAYVDNLKLKNRHERLVALENSLPAWLGRIFIRYRYIVIAIALNIPGNALLGGGGGIALGSGFSRLFSPPLFLMTVAFAVAPVPFAVYIFGSGILD